MQAINWCLVWYTKIGESFFLNFRNNARNRKLWDKTDVKWQHDMYVEADQGPKSKEELQVTIFYNCVILFQMSVL